MATVKKASHFMVYALAFLISGFFSVFGMAVPSWASEAIKNHYSHVFKQYHVAKNDYILSKPSVIRSEPERKSDYIRSQPSYIRSEPEHAKSSVSYILSQPSFRAKVETLVQQLQERANQNEEMDPAEIGVLQSARNAELIDEISIQLKIILEKLNKLDEARTE